MTKLSEIIREVIESNEVILDLDLKRFEARQRLRTVLKKVEHHLKYNQTIRLN